MRSLSKYVTSIVATTRFDCVGHCHGNPLLEKRKEILFIFRSASNACLLNSFHDCSIKVLMFKFISS